MNSAINFKITELKEELKSANNKYDDWKEKLENTDYFESRREILQDMANICIIRREIINEIRELKRVHKRYSSSAVGSTKRTKTI